MEVVSRWICVPWHEFKQHKVSVRRASALSQLKT